MSLATSPYARSALFLAAAAAGGLTGCAGAPPRTVLAAPAGFTGFPARSTDPEIWVEATLAVDDADGLGRDLLRRGFLPVVLRVGRPQVGASSGGDAPRLSPAELDARLYLQDGTALAWTPHQELGGRLAERTAGRALALGAVPDWRDAREGLVLFRLGDVRIQEGRALTRRGASYRELELRHSLVAITVSTAAGPREVVCGLRETFGRGASGGRP